MSAVAARRQQQHRQRLPDRGFNTATLVQIAGIPVLTAGVYFVMQWALTGDTLKRHDDAIKTIQVEAKANIDAEIKAREDARKTFLDNQLKTTEILGKLDTRLAVSETKQETANQTLKEIAQELTRIGTTAARR